MIDESTDNVIMDNGRPVFKECRLCGRRRSIFDDTCICVQEKSGGKRPLGEGESYLLTEDKNG